VGEVNLYITPGHLFRVVDRMITNFHLPRHTPLLLAAAFAGTDLLRESYRDALSRDYRFLSYGDAMAIL
jgi:S-adenosylmethionine:tRNA ribosyltransferase-isomerase